MNNQRFDIYFDRHIGFGIRWDTDFTRYTIELSISIPFLTVTISFGKDKDAIH